MRSKVPQDPVRDLPQGSVAQHQNSYCYIDAGMRIQHCLQIQLKQIFLKSVKKYKKSFFA